MVFILFSFLFCLSTNLFLAEWKPSRLLHLNLKTVEDISKRNTPPDGEIPSEETIKDVLRALSSHVSNRIVQIQFKTVDQATKNSGNTPLHYAVSLNMLHTVQFLLLADANVNSRNKEWKTSLMISSSHGLVAIVSLLLCCHADQIMRCRCGNMAIHYAVINNQYDVVKVLVMANREVLVSCEANDMTPLQMAIKNGLVETVSVLLGLGADINHATKNELCPLKRVELLRFRSPIREMIQEASKIQWIRKWLDLVELPDDQDEVGSESTAEDRTSRDHFSDLPYIMSLLEY